MILKAFLATLQALNIIVAVAETVLTWANEQGSKRKESLRTFKSYDHFSVPKKDS